MLIVQVCHLGEDGDAAYRLHDPSRFLGRIDNVTTVDCHFAHGALPELSRRADVLILQFVNDWDLLSYCRSRRERGQFTVFEANDYFFDLQPWNPISQGWSNRINQELYLQLIREADAVQASSRALAQEWLKRRAREVVVFENHLVDIPALTTPQDRPLTIGWAGSPGHFADWMSLVPTLKVWLDRHPQVRLAVMTNELAHSFFQLPADRYRFTPFGSLNDYFRFLETIDIGIAPLLPSQYNRCRSDVKFLEYASRGVVGLYADLDPYRGSVDHEKNGFLWENHSELTQWLDRLVAEPGLRNRVREQAHHDVLTNRQLKNRIHERWDWYRDHCANQSTTSTTSLPVSLSFEVGSRYARIAPEEAETIYLEAQGQPVANGAMTKVDQALKLKPEHYGFQCLKGQFLNDLGKGALAREILEKATHQEPQLARAWTELGRAWFRHGEIPQALSALEKALAINPIYLPAWQYLIRLMTHHNHPDLVSTARKGLALFPDCFPMAALCIEALGGPAAIESFADTLTGLKETMQPYENKVLLVQVRRLVETLLKQGLTGVQLAPVITKAHELFPESIWFCKTLGEAMIQQGPDCAPKGFSLLAQAAQLLYQSQITREEIGDQTPIPWEWQFAQNITRHSPPQN